ncbi:MAG: UpxY family transcription antiterminator [Flavobacteriales bacterium]|nr:UpxY family transcription antiterminator [Flavobacteriales bacterium]MBS4039973.1 UpxY family transcription antiterminator [Flavobacteriales bacterium]
MPWYAIYTKPRSEKKVAVELRKKGWNVYCPMVQTIRQWSDRKKKVEVPLINSYIFVQVDENTKASNLLVTGTIKILMFEGKPAIISDNEIEILQNYSKGVFQHISIENYQIGDKIIIPEGAFKNIEGIVHQTSSNKLTIILPSLGMKVILEK